MTTVINTPESNNMMSTIITLVVLLVIGYFFYIYGLPAIRNIGTPQINVPNQIDVNIKQDGK